MPVTQELSRNYDKITTTLPDVVEFPLLEDEALLDACFGLLAICADALETGLSIKYRSASHGGKVPFTMKIE